MSTEYEQTVLKNEPCDENGFPILNIDFSSVEGADLPKFEFSNFYLPPEECESVEKDVVLPQPESEKEHKNFVTLLGWYGGDKHHCLSAWNSTYDEIVLKQEGICINSNRVEDMFSIVAPRKRNTPDFLLKMLAEDGHHTPFEKSCLHFLVTCDIATHIHFLKHRIGVSINSESARWKELKRDAYLVPSDWPDDEREKHIEFCEYCLKEYHEAYKRLEKHYLDNGYAISVAKKRAKETARFKLPYSNQIAMDIMFNFRSFAHFLKLRYSFSAQKEIRDIAQEMLEMVRDIGHFNKSLQCFGFIDKNGNLSSPSP